MRSLRKVFKRRDVNEAAAREVEGVAREAAAPAPTAAAEDAVAKETTAKESLAKDVAAKHEKPSAASNLERWKASGHPQRWVEAHDYHWNHADWLALLRDLERSDFWPMDPAEVGAVLEALKAQHAKCDAIGV
ncbi:MAG: hypothetical protein HY721_29595 [Planctomycetes bacterium]|nr:hypothetical protein [Planctomycetota bacterium]